MKILCGPLLVLVALSASACGSGHPSTAPTIAPKEVAATHPVPSLAKLPPELRKVVEHALRANKHPSKYSRVNAIEVYGPGSLDALDGATEGQQVAETPHHRGHYYVTVLYGHFICIMCHGLWRSPPRGTVETMVWSPILGGSSFGLMRKLPRAVSQLHRLIRIQLR
jgi:hypothetical protein